MVLKMKKFTYIASLLSVFLYLSTGYGSSPLTLQKTGKFTYLGTYSGGEKSTTFQGHDFRSNEKEEKRSGIGIDLKIERQKADGFYFAGEFSTISGHNEMKVKDHLRDGLNSGGSEISMEGDLERKVYELGIKFGYSFLPYSSHLFTPYVGASYDYLKEKAKFTTSSYEESNFFAVTADSYIQEEILYLGVGLQYQYLYSNEWSYILDASMYKSVRQEREEFLGSYGDINDGYKITYSKVDLEFSYQESANLAVVFGPEIRIKSYAGEEIKEKDYRINLGLSSKF